MSELIFSRLTLIWLGLVVATGLSWESVRVAEHGREGAWAVITVMVIAFVKVRFVGLEFMELKTAPIPVRLIFELWLVLVCAAILLMRLVFLA